MHLQTVIISLFDQTLRASGQQHQWASAAYLETFTFSRVHFNHINHTIAVDAMSTGWRVSNGVPWPKGGRWSCWFIRKSERLAF